NLFGVNVTSPAMEAQSPIHSSCIALSSGNGRKNALASDRSAMQHPTNPFLYKLCQNPGRLRRSAKRDSNNTLQLESTIRASETTTSDLVESNIWHIVATLFEFQISSWSDKNM